VKATVYFGHKMLSAYVKAKKIGTGTAVFSYRHKWNHIYACMV